MSSARVWDLFVFISSRFALKHFFVDFARVLGFESDSSRFALKHFLLVSQGFKASGLINPGKLYCWAGLNKTGNQSKTKYANP